MARTGRPKVANTPRPNFTLRLPEDLHAELKIYCSKTKQSLGALITDLTREWWEKNPEKESVRKFLESQTPKEAVT